MIKSVNPMVEFWRGKRVLLTGHTGFKGAWMAIWLRQLGAQVTGVGLNSSTTPSLFELAEVQSITDSHFLDIREAVPLASLIKNIQPEVVFHLVAQALVPASYQDPLTTFATNVQGTANVLDAVRFVESVRVVVAVTTDKVYKNSENCYPFRETDELGGYDPYSASKAAAEMVISSYRDSYLKDKGIAVASARAGNVIGGGDWSSDRLIPDTIRAWTANQPLQIRHPQAVRPWQHVLEPLCGYMKLAEKLWQQPQCAGAYNFGPESHEVASVREVVQLAKSIFGKGQIAWGDGTEGPHEAGWLALEIAKSRDVLGVKPRWPILEAVGRTINWYRQQQVGANVSTICKEDLAAYEAARLSDTPI